MATYIALLRGINVGGNKKVSMSALKTLAEDLGLREPRTLLQSGNLVFESDARSASALESTLEAAVAEKLDVRCDFCLRNAKEWRAIVKANPFERETKEDPSHALVMVLKSAPAAATVKALEEAIVGPERVHLNGRELYLCYPDGMGRSKLTNTLIERKLGTRGTARNWNTVLKLAEMIER
jgi:uncharacterized protein (DUF1697 family)